MYGDYSKKEAKESLQILKQGLKNQAISKDAAFQVKYLQQTESERLCPCNPTTACLIDRLKKNVFPFAGQTGLASSPTVRWPQDCSLGSTVKMRSSPTGEAKELSVVFRASSLKRISIKSSG